MKLVKKDNLKFKNGVIVSKKGNIKMPHVSVVMEANTLEKLYQKALYLFDQPEAVAEPSLAGFEFESAQPTMQLEAKTPILDKRIKQTIKLMDEIDSASTANKVNDIIDQFKELIEFVKNDEFITDTSSATTFDTAKLGNPLKWTEDDLMDAFVLIADTGAMDARKPCSIKFAFDEHPCCYVK